MQDGNMKAENAAVEEHRNRTVERLGETKKRNAEKQDEQAQTAKEEDRHWKWWNFWKKSEKESAPRKEEWVIWSWDEKSQKEDIIDKNATTSCKC